MENRWPPVSVNRRETPWDLRRRATRRPPCRTVPASASVLMDRNLPPVRGVARRRPWDGARAAGSVGPMEQTPRTDPLAADLELMLRESDREDPILPEYRPAEQEPEEEIDSRILAV